MGLIIDLVVILIIVLFALIGRWKGFFKSFLSMFGFFGSLIVAIVFRDQFSAVLNSLFGLQGKLEAVISTRVVEMSPSLAQEVATNTEMIEIINSSNLSPVLKGIFGGLAKSATIVEPMSVADLVVSPIATLCVTVISVIIFFLLIRALVMILNLTIGKVIKKMKVVGRFNKLLGFILGIVKGVVFVGSIMVVANVFSLIPAVENFVATNIESSLITKWGYNMVGDFIVGELEDLTVKNNSDNNSQGNGDTSQEGSGEGSQEGSGEGSQEGTGESGGTNNGDAQLSFDMHADVEKFELILKIGA